MIDTYSEEFRQQTEAAEWLRRSRDKQGKLDPTKVNALLLRIAQRRGKAAADQLREAMRAEYRKIKLPTLAK